MMAAQGRPCRVLVVEDEMMIAVLIEDALTNIGFEIVGPAAKLDSAFKLVAEARFDIAILDVSLRGEMIFPVAEQLLKRGIPFAFASGYGDWALPPEMRDRPRLMKPFAIRALQEQARALCAQLTREPALSQPNSAVPD